MNDPNSPGGGPMTDDDRPEESPGGPLRTAILGVVLLTLLCGIAFPLALGAIAWVLFPGQAAGSLIVRDGIVVGSEPIGQDFTGPDYFHSRPSAAGRGYDATASGGTNLGPSHPKLRDGARDDPATSGADESFAGVKELAEAYRTANGLGPNAPVPADAVTRSASGLDRTSARPMPTCRSRGSPGPAA